VVTKGQYIKLENKDWRGDARGFCKAIKALEGVTFNPAELDEDGWWFVPNKHKPKIADLYYRYIGKPLADMDADALAGFKPTPKAGGRYVRARLRY